jgi:uncharacterized membrane protein YgdD (TMEM256/DUF423 family)
MAAMGRVDWRQVLAVMVLVLLAVLSYKQVMPPAWLASLGVFFSIGYLLFSGWLSGWNNLLRGVSRVSRGR